MKLLKTRTLLTFVFAIFLSCTTSLTAFGQVNEVGGSDLVMSIDIKPGNCTNIVNAKSMGILPIAIIGSQDLNVGDIDKKSIKLEYEGQPLTIHGKEISFFKKAFTYDVTAPPSETVTCDDEFPDGINDLIIKYKIKTITNALMEAGVKYKNGDKITLTVSATANGETFKGSDIITIKKPGRKK